MCAHLTGLDQDSHITVFALSFPSLRQLTPGFLASLEFPSNRPEHPLLKGIDALRWMNAHSSRTIPNGSTLDFVPASWRRCVVRECNVVLPAHYELCALWQLRAALRSGEVWVENSRRYANPEGYLIPEDRWPTLKVTRCEILGLPAEQQPRLRGRQDEPTNCAAHPGRPNGP